MTARHAGPVKPGETSALDQLRACQHELSAFIAARAAAPVHLDWQAAWRDSCAANIRALDIMGRTLGVLMQVEWDVEHG